MPETDWRTDTIERVRSLIHEVDPDISEEAKWIKPSNPAGVPAWTRDGLICTGEIYKDKVKVTFFNGASLEDPSHLFNAGLDAGTRRAIDIVEDAGLDEQAFQGPDPRRRRRQHRPGPFEATRVAGHAVADHRSSARPARTHRVDDRPAPDGRSGMSR